MYDFVDRPVGALNTGGRVLVWSMRQWVKAASAKRCPCSDVGPAFHHWGLLGGLSHFHVMMMSIARNSRQRMYFCEPECCCIGESEALLLELFCTLRERGDADFRQTAGLILQDAAVLPFETAATSLGWTLTGRNMFPERLRSMRPWQP